MTPSQRRAHMRELGRRSQASRLHLSADEREKLIQAYQHIGSIMRRHGLDVEDGGRDG